MRFLSVAERELRAASRQKGTYRSRWITAAVFFFLLVWMIWVWEGFQTRRAGPQIFQGYAVLIFIYSIIIGTIRTADCISSEKREGTLGLLFLTNLNSAEIVAGKLCTHSLAAIYGLVAIFPMLALPLLMGGVTFEFFWKIVLALVNAILFSVAAGFLASAFSLRQFTAVALAMGLVLGVSVGAMVLAGIMSQFRSTRPWADEVAMFSPIYSLVTANGRGWWAANKYWTSLLVVAGVSASWLGIVTWRLSRTWRDRPKTARAAKVSRVSALREQVRSAHQVALRRRLLQINPFLWLDTRRRLGFFIIMGLLVGLVTLTSFGTARWFSTFTGGAINRLEAHVFAWLWTGLLIHALVLYYAAMVASQRLAEDKQAGALELILCTPTTERIISRGLWLAFARKMAGPALIAVLVHLFFIWQGATMFTLTMSELRHLSPGQLLWRSLLSQPLGTNMDWTYHLVLRVLLLALIFLMGLWVTVGWVARWLGLRMKHPGFAPMVTIAITLGQPILIFSFLCYVFDDNQFFRMSARHGMPILTWLAFWLGIGHCLALSFYAARQLRYNFRTMVASRFQTPRHFWQLPSWRVVKRAGLGLAGGAAALVLIVLTFYGYQNWNSNRAWMRFQKELKQNGQSLDLAARLPAALPDELNFERSEAFRQLTGRKHVGLLAKFSYLNGPQTAPIYPNGLDWIQHNHVPLGRHVQLLARNPGKVDSSNRVESARAILAGLQSHSGMLQAIATASRLPYFQTVTNRDASAVIHPRNAAVDYLEKLHQLYIIRASARLSTGEAATASEDVLTSLQFVRLMRQSPLASSSSLTRVMALRSLQPIWEGLAGGDWTDAQLESFQKELGRFNFLVDYTNAVSCVVLAHIEAWRAIAEGKATPAIFHLPDVSAMRSHQLQPRGWWMDNCRYLFEMGRIACKRVDFAAEQFHPDTQWMELDGLPMDQASSQLIQQYPWWGTQSEGVAFAQTAINQAIIACALARHRMAHGAYPQTLDELVPDFLQRVPRDISRGRPMFYELKVPGPYELRGGGPNTQIDSGKPASDDWVWAFPTNVPPAILESPK